MNKELKDMTLEELWTLFPIYLEEHKSYWKEWYQEEEAYLRKILSMEQIERISHIGSTSIPSIWAKPIVDIMIETSKNCGWSVIKKQIISAGYTLMYEEDSQIGFNKGYTMDGFAKRVYHLHLRRAGDNDELYFKEYLLEHRDVAKEYETLKLGLWKKYEHNRDAYTDSKTEFIEKYTFQAKNKYKDKIVIEEANPDSAQARILMDELSDCLEEITGSNGKNSFQNSDVYDARGKFIFAKDRTGSLMGCGALRPLTEDTAEIKRVYSRENRYGIGSKIVKYLEESACDLRYNRIFIETRKVNTRAVRFYLRSGYRVTANYGKYMNRDECICFEKDI